MENKKLELLNFNFFYCFIFLYIIKNKLLNYDSKRLYVI